MVRLWSWRRSTVILLVALAEEDDEEVVEDDEMESALLCRPDARGVESSSEEITWGINKVEAVLMKRWAGGRL